MKGIQPLISIGLPVYNGEDFLEEAIKSLLNQTFTNFEIIISDNASTDKTEKICRDYALKDQRIRYYRQSKNLGPAPNFNYVFNLALGKYFKWAAHDDLCEASFLEKCVEILENKPEIVLCYSQVNIIDKNGKTLEFYAPEFKSNSPKVQERFYDLTGLHHRCYQIFGLIRTNVLKQTSLIGSYAGSDRCLLASLSLYGQFFEIPAALFQARRHQNQSIQMLFKPENKFLRLHKYAEWFDPRNKGKIIFPNWRILKEYILAINNSPLVIFDKILCFLQLIRWLFAYGNGAKLVRDLLIALLQISQLLFSKNKLKVSTS